MYARRLVPTVTLAALALASATAAGCVRTKGDVQRDYARTLRPARLSAGAEPAGPIRALPVRVHADEEYRAQTLRWAPFAFEPVYVLGMVAGAEGRWTEARDLLRRALEREERERDVWERLGMVYGKLGDAAELDALDRRHRARFGVPLRPSW